MRTVQFLFLGLAVGFSLPAYAIAPPARFDHPYHGHLIVRSVGVALAEKQCERYGSFACSTGDDKATDSCTIWLPKIGEVVHYQNRAVRFDPAFKAGVLQHEIAHCNGWPANHPS